jgi:hypothetical protein
MLTLAYDRFVHVTELSQVSLNLRILTFSNQRDELDGWTGKMAESTGKAPGDGLSSKLSIGSTAERDFSTE